MPTARARMLTLSPLAAGAIARAHFLAIELGGGGEPGEPVFVPVSGGFELDLPVGTLEMAAELPAVLELDSQITSLELTADDTLIGWDDASQPDLEL